MTNKKISILGGVALTLAAIGWTAGTLQAQQPGFKRVELQRHDIAIEGREAVQARAEIEPGASVPKHTHPGDEVAYVLDGQLTLEVDGKPPATLKTGDVFFIPSGQAHAVKNVGKSQAKILATYIVEKGKPLASPVK